MKKTTLTTFYSLAIGAAGLMVLFASGCGGGESESCADDEINIAGQGCRASCNPNAPSCPDGQICQAVTGGGGACVPDSDNGDPQDAGGDMGDDPIDSGTDTQTDTPSDNDTGEDSGQDAEMTDTKEDGGGGFNRARSRQTCFEILFCLQFKCFGEQDVGSCFTRNFQNGTSSGQNNFNQYDQCVLGLTAQTPTCETACGEQGTASQCDTCIQNNCPNAANACGSSAPPAETQTCGDAFQCIQGCSVQSDTDQQFQTCLQNSCPSLVSTTATQGQDAIDMITCVNDNLGFGRGQNEGPDAGIGTNDAGMQVETCSTRADNPNVGSAGNGNFQVDTAAEQTAEISCLQNNCGMQINSCLGCQ